MFTLVNMCKLTEMIRISRKSKEELGKLKSHKREAYGDVIERLIEKIKKR